jgi:hypothetical protein
MLECENDMTDSMNDTIVGTIACISEAKSARLQSINFA